MNAAQQYVPSFVIKAGGVELRHGFTTDVTSVSITDTCDRADTFSFTLRDRHPEPGRFAGGGALQWLDSGTFAEEKEVEIALGYRGAERQTLLGVITGVSPTFPESGPPTLTVRGSCLYHRLTRQCEPRPFREKTDSGIAREIAAILGLDPGGVEETNAEHPLVSPGQGTYAAILQQRAARIGFELVVKGKTLHFERPRYIAAPGPALTLEWGRSLRSFTPSLSTYRKATHVTVRAAQTSQGQGKDPLVGKAEPGAERVKLGGESASQIAMRVAGRNEILAEDHLAASPMEADEVARARLEASSLDFITGRGSCNGNPELRARMVIELKGLGKLFSGHYYVTSATHTVDGSGYRTDFEVKRNGR